MEKGVYDTNTPHFKGTFLTIYAVNQKYPTGGVDGDWCLINGWAHYWDADRGTWCVNSQRDTYWDELFSGVKFNTENIMKKYEYLLFDLSKKANTSDVQASLDELKKEIGDRTVVEGNVTNLPDEEDITSGKNASGTDVLSLKDRAYNPLSFSGKGYKILRKNIKPVSLAVTKIIVGSIPTVEGAVVFTINGVEASIDMVTTTMTTTDLVAQKIEEKLTETMTEYEVSKDASTITLTRKFGGSVTPSVFSASTTGVVCTVTDSTKNELRNIITPIMINQPNTIYEIRYDFDLNGETIEMQEGCTLKFEGGMLRNGKVISYKTNICGSFINLYNFYGKIYNVANEEITRRGDVIKRRFPIICPLSTSILLDGYEMSFLDTMINTSFDIGVTTFSLVMNIDSNGNLRNVENVLSHIKDLGLDVYLIKFHSTIAYNEIPEESVRNNYHKSVVEGVKLCAKYFSFKEVCIANEKQNWYYTEAWIETLKSISKDIKDMGFLPCITSNGLNSMKSASGCKDFCSYTVNYYPCVSLMTPDNVDMQDSYSRLLDSFNNHMGAFFVRGIFNEVRITECGIMPYNLALRAPWYYHAQNLKGKNVNVPKIFYSIVLDVLKHFNTKYLSLWFVERYNDDDIKNNLYNLFLKF